MSMFAFLNEKIHNYVSFQQITSHTEVQRKYVPIVLGRRTLIAVCFDYSTT
ncbi:MAG: hypothetical protein RTU09_03245 [Candidatus Thorarchaeota archaeon]